MTPTKLQNKHDKFSLEREKKLHSFTSANTKLKLLGGRGAHLAISHRRHRSERIIFAASHREKLPNAAELGKCEESGESGGKHFSENAIRKKVAFFTHILTLLYTKVCEIIPCLWWLFFGGVGKWKSAEKMQHSFSLSFFFLPPFSGRKFYVRNFHWSTSVGAELFVVPLHLNEWMINLERSSRNS